MLPWWGTYLLVINVAAYALFAHDKRAAERGTWRVSENHLLLISAIGGGVGAFAAQRRYRHKTRKILFQFLFGMLVLLQIAGLILVVIHRDRLRVLF